MEIYLIEDDEIYAEFIRKALLSQNASWKIRHFPTAEDAEKAINGQLPEVLIIDYKLPGISGIDSRRSYQGKDQREQQGDHAQRTRRWPDGTSGSFRKV